MRISFAKKKEHLGKNRIPKLQALLKMQESRKS